MWQLSERSSAAALRTWLFAWAMLSESLSRALRHSSVVAIVIDGTSGLRGSVWA